MAGPLMPVLAQYQRWRMSTNVHGAVYEQRYLTFLRSGFNQYPPYIDTNLTVDVGIALDGYSDAGAWSVDPISDATVQARNSARADFVEQLGTASQLGSTLTSELKKTWGTVVQFVTTGLMAARAVRKGDMLTASGLLGFNPPTEYVRRSKRRKKRNGVWTKKIVTTERWVMPDGRRVLKNAAGRWLWFSYGVKPLCQDIHNAMEVLVSRSIPAFTIVNGKGSGRTSANPGGYYSTRYNWHSSVRCSAQVSVKNPNLWLANQLGLINPAQFFLEGINLSFVADWFSNLSQIVQQCTDFVGLNIDKPMTTEKHTLDVNEFHPDYGVAFHVRRIRYHRFTSIPEAQLRFAYERFNWQRGLNAISLLIGTLGQNHKRAKGSFNFGD